MTEAACRPRGQACEITIELAAYDERTKRPTPEQEVERKRRAEEEERKAEARKREAEEEAKRTQALKQELLSVLLDLAQKDAEAQVRLAAVSSIGRLELEASIVPLSRIAVKDPANAARQVALKATRRAGSDPSPHKVRLRPSAGPGRCGFTLGGCWETPATMRPARKTPATIPPSFAPSLACCDPESPPSPCNSRGRPPWLRWTRSWPFPRGAPVHGKFPVPFGPAQWP